MPKVKGISMLHFFDILLMLIEHKLIISGYQTNRPEGWNINLP